MGEREEGVGEGVSERGWWEGREKEKGEREGRGGRGEKKGEREREGGDIMYVNC